MTIEEAIKILTKTDPYSPHSFVPGFRDALALGIEALCYVQGVRDVLGEGHYSLLPGETE